jgi:hypothetical protein
VNLTYRVLRFRIGHWLERQPWAREFVLREDPDSAQHVEYPVRVMLRVRAVNRVNGHIVIRDRPPRSWKRDGYVTAALIGGMFGAIVMFALGTLFGLAGSR